MLDSSWNFDLTQPAFLAGLLILPLLVYYFWHSLVDFARWQRLTSLACRTLIVLLLVLSLAGLTLQVPTHEPFVVFLLDHSRSIEPEARRQAEDFVEQALHTPGKHRSAFIYFAAEPGPVLLERPEEAPALDEDATNLAAALEVATGLIPPSFVPRIVLLSDGNETTGDARTTAARAGVPVSTVPLRARAEPDVQLSAVNVPAQVHQGEPFEIEVLLDSNHEDQGILELYRGPHKIAERTCQVTPGEKREKFVDTLVQGGLAIYSASIRGFREDRLLENNTNMGLTFAAGKPRVLLLDSDPAQAKRHLAAALEPEGIQVDVRPGRGMPDSLTELQNYDLLILSNVPATALTQRQMEVARIYVEELGGGLIMLGGDQSFGLGGYYKTVLEDILPVRSDFEKEKEKPSLAMMLLIDRSGSMEGEKMELAKEAAKSAVQLLGPSDKIGVIAFDTESTWISELRPASDKNYVLDQISKIHAGGGTHISPSMIMAYETLRDVSSKYKHIILLTDGEPNDTDHGDFQGIAANMATAHMTFSTVGVGSDADKKFLEELATIGKGRFYFTDEPSSIPQIFAKETVTASRSAINERPFLPVLVQRTKVLENVDFQSAPDLLGHVLTRPKPTSEVVLATERGDPLLAWWRYGLGMTVAFTSDATSRWAADWISNWPEGYSKFWTQIIRMAMRKNEAKGIQVQVTARDRRATVTIDAATDKGEFINGAETELTLIDPRLGSVRMPMTQTAPGHYAAELATPWSGAYHLEVAQKYQGNLLNRQSRGLAVGYPEELRLRPTNEALLQQLALATGGVYQPPPEEVFAPGVQTAQRPEPLWPYLVLVAAILLLVDVALRRLDLSLFLPARRRRPVPVVRATSRV
jgi:Mg-chelatase subunit ChlD